MPSTHTEHVAVGHLADQAEHAIRRLTHLTRPATGELADPADAAQVIAALAAMTWMLPQLLGQLAHWLEHEHHAGRLRADNLALPDPDQPVQPLASNLQHASQALRDAAEALDAAHQHAAHLAVTNPDQDPARRGQDSCRSVGPTHLTRRTRITWCVDQHALGVVTGEVGAGKTVAVRAATTALDPSRHVVIYLPNPTVGVRGMFHHIVATLGQVPCFYTATLAPQAADALAAEHAERGRTPVLVIDEAHLLDNPQMEAVRILTNHDMDSGAPFATLLVGQPTLRQRLRLGVLAALDQRIGVRATINGMSPADTADYITHHLKLAGRTDTLFTADATTLIHNASRGYPRAVNNLALNALTAAFTRDNPIVDEKAARAAIAETNTD